MLCCCRAIFGNSNQKMRLLILCTLLILLIMQTCSLTCRSEHGPKDEDLRKIYNNCLKQQEGNSNENTRLDNGWKNRGDNQRKENKDSGSEEGEGKRNTDNKGNRENNKDQRANNNGRVERRQNSMSDNRGTDERYNSNDGRNNRNGMDVNNRGRNNMAVNSYGTTGHLRGQDEFLQSEEYEDASQNSYYSSLKPPRRYRREKHTEMNSGQRSQYNPHSQRTNEHENDHGQEGRNSSNNSSKENDKTSDSGMPDRHLVTHALTKDEKNEDLRDFLQESIEECFQILQNENTEDKCEFSKNLLTCLSEKGRANCDDWNGKPSFLF